MTGRGSSVAWRWRKALTQSELPATARLVLLVLSTHMNEHGGSCYPSIETQCKKTGLSKPCVIKYLAAAERAGWLKSKRRGLGNRRYNLKEYFARFPDGFVDQHEAGQVTGQDEQGLPSYDRKTVNEGDHDGKPSSLETVNEVNPRTPDNISLSISVPDGVCDADASPPSTGGRSGGQVDGQEGQPGDVETIGMAGMQCWLSVRSALARTQGDRVFNAWVRPLRLIATAPSLVIEAPTGFARDHVISRWGDEIRRLLWSAFGDERPVEWIAKKERAVSLPLGCANKDIKQT